MSEPADYETMTAAQAQFLRGVVTHRHIDRRKVLRWYMTLNGAEALVELFSSFIGLSNSVVENNREAIELFGICNGEHPDTAEKYNLPTIAGALKGRELASTVPRQRGLCHGCAYRLGSVANQSPITTDDAQYCTEPGEDLFWCHEHMDERGKPTKICGGHKQRMRASEREQEKGG